MAHSELHWNGLIPKSIRPCMEALTGLVVGCYQKDQSNWRHIDFDLPPGIDKPETPTTPAFLNGSAESLLGKE